jgi:hypothetical protein
MPGIEKRPLEVNTHGNTESLAIANRAGHPPDRRQELALRRRIETGEEARHTVGQIVLTNNALEVARLRVVEVDTEGTVRVEIDKPRRQRSSSQRHPPKARGVFLRQPLGRLANGDDARPLNRNRETTLFDTAPEDPTRMKIPGVRHGSRQVFDRSDERRDRLAGTLVGLRIDIPSITQTRRNQGFPPECRNGSKSPVDSRLDFWAS